jgi:hypothetical protein
VLCLCGTVHCNASLTSLNRFPAINKYVTYNAKSCRTVCRKRTVIINSHEIDTHQPSGPADSKHYCEILSVGLAYSPGVYDGFYGSSRQAVAYHITAPCRTSFPHGQVACTQDSRFIPAIFCRLINETSAPPSVHDFPSEKMSLPKYTLIITTHVNRPSCPSTNIPTIGASPHDHKFSQLCSHIHDQ